MANGALGDFQDYLSVDSWDTDHAVMDIDPCLLSAKASKYNEDNPAWEMAMHGPHTDEYWKACETELETLETDLGCWDLVRRTAAMKVLPSTWAFKCK